MIRGLGISVLVVSTFVSLAVRAQGAPLDQSQTKRDSVSGNILPAPDRPGLNQLPPAERTQQGQPAEPPDDEDEYEHGGTEVEEEGEEAKPAEPPAEQPEQPPPPPPPEPPPPEEEVAQPPEEVAEPPVTAAGPEAGAMMAEEEEGFRDTGYIPGYKRWPSLGLSPHAPKQPHSYFGGVTPAFGAPTEEGSWRFDFNGSLTARYSVGLDESVRGDGLAFQIPPRRELPYQRGVRTNLRFTYASPYVEATVGYWSWLTRKEWEGVFRPGREGSGFFDAYALFHLPEFGDWVLDLQAGAFSTTFGGPHKWTWGIWGPLAAIKGYGYHFKGIWDLDPEWDIEVRQAFVAMPKVPEDYPLGGYTNWGTTGQASFAHAWNAGVIYDSKYILRGTLVSAFAPETRAGRNTFDPDDGKDGRFDIWILEAHYLPEFFGEYNISYSYNKMSDATAVHGAIWWATNWTQGANDEMLLHLGPASRGNGSYHVISWEVDYSLRQLIDQDFYDPQASDVTLALAAIHGFTGDTQDRAFVGKKLLALTADVEYRMLSWFGTRFIYSFQDLDLRTAGDHIQMFAPGVTFRSDWDSPDVIDLRYKYYLRPEGWLINPNAPDARHVVEFVASVSW